MPLWESSDTANQGCKLTADYIPSKHEYEVKAVKDGKEEVGFVKATWEPRFGIDVADMDEIYRKAGELSDKLK